VIAPGQVDHSRGTGRRTAGGESPIRAVGQRRTGAR